jgi:tRNA pseudouridine55 synthase
VSQDGILLVDKPAGPTSHDVVQRARRLLRERRIGHTGTLDPFASGLLVLCVGASARLSEYLTGLEKGYDAHVRLGQKTATLDTESPVIEEHEGWRSLTREQIEQALEPLRGEILQIPPAHSAKKIGGEAAHRRVRRGEEVALPPSRVTVHAIEVTDLSLPDVRLSVRCSSGTYIRALARDLGDALGVGAHLTALRRTHVGQLRVEDAVEIGESTSPDDVARAWREPVDALGHLPSVGVGEQDWARLSHGQAIEVDGSDGADPTVLVLRGGKLAAVAAREGRRLRPLKVFLGAGS